jgi:hypothetical protein
MQCWQAFGCDVGIDLCWLVYMHQNKQSIYTRNLLNALMGFVFVFAVFGTWSILIVALMTINFMMVIAMDRNRYSPLVCHAAHCWRRPRRTTDVPGTSVAGLLDSQLCVAVVDWILPAVVMGEPGWLVVDLDIGIAHVLGVGAWGLALTCCTARCFDSAWMYTMVWYQGGATSIACAHCE